MGRKSVLLLTLLCIAQPQVQCNNYYGWFKLVADFSGTIAPSIIAWFANIHGQHYAKELKQKEKIKPINSTVKFTDLTCTVPEEIQKLADCYQKRSLFTRLLGYFWTCKNKIISQQILLHGKPAIDMTDLIYALASRSPVYNLDLQDGQPSIKQIYQKASNNGPAIVVLNGEEQYAKYSPAHLLNFLQKTRYTNIATIIATNNLSNFTQYKQLKLCEIKNK